MKITITAEDVLNLLCPSPHHREHTLLRIAQSKGLPVKGLVYLEKEVDNSSWNEYIDNGNIVIEVTKEFK